MNLLFRSESVSSVCSFLYLNVIQRTSPPRRNRWRSRNRHLRTTRGTQGSRRWGWWRRHMIRHMRYPLLSIKTRHPSHRSSRSRWGWCYPFCCRCRRITRRWSSGWCSFCITDGRREGRGSAGSFDKISDELFVLENLSLERILC